MTKFEECVKAASEESTDEGKVRAVIRRLMNPDRSMVMAAFDYDDEDGRASGEMHLIAMLEAVLDEGTTSGTP